MSKKLVPIHEAAEAFGVSAQTLRRWEREGRLLPDERTAGGRRRYDLARLKPEMFRSQADAARKTAAYARVSSHDQKDDLERQKQVLEICCARLHGSRSRKDQKLLDGMKKAVEEARA